MSGDVPSEGVAHVIAFVHQVGVQIKIYFVKVHSIHVRMGTRLLALRSTCEDVHLKIRQSHMQVCLIDKKACETRHSIYCGQVHPTYEFCSTRSILLPHGHDAEEQQLTLSHAGQHHPLLWCADSPRSTRQSSSCLSCRESVHACACKRVC